MRAIWSLWFRPFWLGESGAPAAKPAAAGTTPLESVTADVFIPTVESTVEVNLLPLREQIEHFRLDVAGLDLYDEVVAWVVDHPKVSIPDSDLTHTLYQRAAQYLGNPDLGLTVIDPEYQVLIRDMVQGILKGGQEYKLRVDELVKITVMTLLLLSPIESIEDLREASRIIAQEIILGKVNLGFTMKISSFGLGKTVVLMAIHSKLNKGAESIFSQPDGPAAIQEGLHEGLWQTTKDVTHGSVKHCKANAAMFRQGMEVERRTLPLNLMLGFVARVVKGFLPKGKK